MVVGPLHIVTAVHVTISVGVRPPDVSGTTDLDFFNTSICSLKDSGLSAISRVCGFCGNNIPNICIDRGLRSKNSAVCDGVGLLLAIELTGLETT